MAAVLGKNNIWNSSTDTVNNQLHVLLDKDYHVLNLAAAVSLLIISPITVAANGIVIAAFILDPLKKLRSRPSNFMVFSLACVDFFTGLVSCPLMAIGFLFSSQDRQPPFSMNYVLVYLAVLKITGLLTLLALSVDRLVAVRTPLQYKYKVTKRRMAIAAISIWSYSLVMGIVLAILHQQKVFAVWIVLVIHITLCAFALKVSSFILLWALRKQSLQLKKISGRESNITNTIQRERKVTQITAVILWVFHICFIPWALCLIILHACFSCSLDIFAFILAFVIVTTINCSCSLIHPFLYAFRLPLFKKTLKDFLKRKHASNVKVPAGKQISLSTIPQNEQHECANCQSCEETKF